MRAETIEIKIEAITATSRLRISKPLTSSEVKYKIRPLITKMKKPKVIIVNGRVRNIIIGRKIAFSKPRTKTARNKARAFDISIPGSNLATSRTAIAVKINRSKNRFMIRFPDPAAATGALI